MKTRPLHLRFTLHFIGLFTAAIGLAKEVPHIVVEGTESPNGRYAVAWGIPYMELDPGNLNDIDYDAIRNFLVDLKSGDQVAMLDTTYFESKNHGGLSTLWRGDSGGLMIVEDGKWGSLSASVVYIVDPKNEYNPCSDVIPVTRGIFRAVKSELLKTHSKHADSIQNFEISMHPLKWVGENKVQLEIVGQVPKDEDAFFYEGKMDANLPGPMTVTIGNDAGNDSPTKSPDRKNRGADWTITANSVGPIKLGMTVAQARAALDGATFSRTSDGEGIALINIDKGDEHLMTIYAGEENPDSKIDDDAEILFIEVWNSTLATTEGIRPGMTISQAEKSIGELREIFVSEIESRQFASFTNQPSGMTFRVTHERGAAGNFRGESTTATSYVPGATILAIEVSGSDIMQDGSIGGIKIDATEADVLDIAKKSGMGRPFKGEDEIWEAFGQAVQTWLFPDAGISVDMISDEIGGPKTVFSITAKDGSEATTGKGISLGAKKPNVINAYADYRTEKGELEIFAGEEDIHLVGSIYGGMIFTFENGQLAQIFLGAAAE